MNNGNTEGPKAPARSAAVHGFAPVANVDAEVLILGTMPGPRSLTRAEYYAHPQNAFWRIIGEILGFDASVPYADRLQALRSARVGLWDVLRTCVREGASDSNIDEVGLVPNGFSEFFARHKEIRLVTFNGAKAESLYRRHVLPQLDLEGKRYLRLPSTSAAHASTSFEHKLRAWREVMQPADA